jgi:hypothetical protein
MLNKAQIIEEINRAFGDTEYPGDTSIVHESSYAATYPDYEGNTVRDVFKGKRWQEVDMKQLARENGAPAFLTDEAFKYYLPAYLNLIVEDILTADVLTDIIIQKISTANFQKSFSPEQESCIENFLEYIKENHPDFYPEK